MNVIKRIIPDIVAIVVFAVISFAYFCPAVTEGRILSQFLMMVACSSLPIIRRLNFD